MSGYLGVALSQKGGCRNIAISLVDPLVSEAGTQSGICRERSPRAYDGVVNVVGNSKSRNFRLSQALAYGVVKKGVCGDFMLCGLSPPVSPRMKMVSQYTLLTTIAHKSKKHKSRWFRAPLLEIEPLGVLQEGGPFKANPTQCIP